MQTCTQAAVFWTMETAEARVLQCLVEQASAQQPMQRQKQPQASLLHSPACAAHTGCTGTPAA